MYGCQNTPLRYACVGVCRMVGVLDHTSVIHQRIIHFLFPSYYNLDVSLVYNDLLNVQRYLQNRHSNISYTLYDRHHYDRDRYDRKDLTRSNNVYQTYDHQEGRVDQHNVVRPNYSKRRQRGNRYESGDRNVNGGAGHAKRGKKWNRLQQQQKKDPMRMVAELHPGRENHRIYLKKITKHTDHPPHAPVE